MNARLKRRRVPEDIRKLVDLAEEQGWTFARTAGGHCKLTSPEGHPVFFGFTPSDVRAGKNLRAMLRRKGLRVP